MLFVWLLIKQREGADELGYLLSGIWSTEVLIGTNGFQQYLTVKLLRYLSSLNCSFPSVTIGPLKNLMLTSRIWLFHSFLLRYYTLTAKAIAIQINQLPL